MKEYILKGDPAEVEKVIKESRIRISRGVISITPAEPETAVTDTKDIPAEDTKDIPAEDTKDAPVADTKAVGKDRKTSKK